MDSISISYFYGEDINKIADDFAQLRISVFREFPYLYKGTITYEKEYIKTYVASKESLLIAVFSKDKIVGASTCIPLKDETQEVQLPFIEAGFNIPEIFYFGESLLLPEFRGKGIGSRFFIEREKHAQSFINYKITTFCSVIRENNHPLKPNNYIPHDVFWAKNGYQKNEQLIGEMDWQDIDKTDPDSKKLIFWTKHF